MQEFHRPETITALMQKMTEIFTQYYADPQNRPPIQTLSKQEAVTQYFEPHPPQSGMGLPAAMDLFQDTLMQTGSKTWHPLYFSQMSAGTPLPAVLGDALASMMNATLSTWENTPTATLIERATTTWMAQILGMKPGSSGIFLPGGSLSNLMALTVARDRILGPEVMAKGLRHLPQQPVIICSEASHYSVANAGRLLGIGHEHVIKVAVNERKEMLIDDFIAKLHECDTHNLKPFAVVVTMGITVSGGYDPLPEIVEACRDRNIHIHVDAAFGGGIALTDEGPQTLAGIEHADTVIWDAHKWLYFPLTSTVLLTPNPAVLRDAFYSGADYLFHPQNEAVDLAEDLGHFTLLCGKRFDALPIWLMFKALGVDYYRNLAQGRMTLTRQFHQCLLDDPDFHPAYEPRSPLICFRYQPPELANASHDYLDNLHFHVRNQAKTLGLAMMNKAKVAGHYHFRTVLINLLTQMDHLNHLMDELRTLCRQYVEAHPPTP